MDIRSFFAGGGTGKKKKVTPKAAPNTVLNKVTKKSPAGKSAKSPVTAKSKASTASSSKPKPKKRSNDEDDDFESKKKLKKSPNKSPTPNTPKPAKKSVSPPKKTEPPNKRAKAVHVAETDDEDDEEAAALALLEGTTEATKSSDEDDEEDEEAAALALLLGTEPNSPKRTDTVNHDEESFGSVNEALVFARNRSPKKSKSPKKESSASPIKASLERSDRRWSCVACTLLNPPSLDSCSVCDAPRKILVKKDKNTPTKQEPIVHRVKNETLPVKRERDTAADSSSAKVKQEVKKEVKKEVKEEVKKEAKAAGGWSTNDMATLKTVTKVEKEKPADDAEKKPTNHRAAFWKMKNRTGPDALGSKEIPEGAPNCLHGMKFICTGVLDSITREQSDELVKRYGGTLTKSVTKKLDYVILGREAGPKKLELIEQYGIKTLDEDQFFDLIRSKGAGPDQEQLMEEELKKSAKKPAKKTSKKDWGKKEHNPSNDATPPSLTNAGALRNGTPGQRLDGNSMLWSVKYAPTSAARIAGQGGPRSNTAKLKHWLDNWYKNQHRDAKKPTKASDDGWEFKCCLMAGPPGVGKTTSAHLVCKELGYAVIEMNASDCRNKKSLQEEVALLLGNTTMTQYFGNRTEKKQALIMDEVDGMGGNADRGGMPELIALIKKTKIPIICMANDKDSQKMRTLKNHVFVNNFKKLQVKNIVAFLMSILHKEGIKCDRPTLEQIVEGTNCDVRQILNNLEMWSQTTKSFTYDGVKKNVHDTAKHIKENPFQFVQKFFNPSFHKKRLGERIETYFNDYSLAPLFVQEMYCKTSIGRSWQELSSLSKAADSIRDGDMLNKQIYAQQDWKLLPAHAVASCIRPGFIINRSLNARMDFPQVMGKTSSEGKYKRLLSEIRHHMRTEIMADSGDMRMNFIPYFRQRLVAPLVKGDDGCNAEVAALLDTYHLSRDDWDSINDLCQLKNSPDPTQDIPSKTKAAFTRFYNKGTHKMSYVEDISAKKKKKRAPSSSSLAGMDDDDVEGLFAEDDDKDDDDVSSLQKLPKASGKAGKKPASKKKK